MNMKVPKQPDDYFAEGFLLGAGMVAVASILILLVLYCV